MRVEALALEQAFGEQQRHGRVVGPRAARQIEGSAAEQVPDGREAARLAKLGVRGQRIAHGQPDQRSLEPLAQRARGIQDIGGLHGIGLARPVEDVIALLVGFRDVRPGLRAFVVAPQLVEPDQRRIGGQAVFDEMTGDRRLVRPMPARQCT